MKIRFEDFQKAAASDISRTGDSEGDSIYMNGFSISLPVEVQLKAARTIAGLKQLIY
ncbi:MAG: FAD-dependent oxidoreductase [Anaerolineales bacterium]|nr:FAD-dependent oxidoreductase [Anaerolineales bacterium]